MLDSVQQTSQPLTCVRPSMPLPPQRPETIPEGGVQAVSCACELDDDEDDTTDDGELAEVVATRWTLALVLAIEGSAYACST